MAPIVVESKVVESKVVESAVDLTNPYSLQIAILELLLQEFTIVKPVEPVGRIQTKTAAELTLPHRIS
jgi:hypothetical protein